MSDPAVIPENRGKRNSADSRLASSQLPGFSRRHWLGAAAAFGISTGFFSQTSAARTPGLQEKLKLGFVGVGNFGINNIAALATEEVTAICDVDETFLGEMQEQFPKAARFTDWRRMVEEAKLDGVVISAPDHQHAHVSIRALAAGLHVYCEKPLTHSIREGILVAKQAAARPKQITQLGVQHHASPGYRQVKELIRSGEIGEVSEVHCWTARPIWPQGELTRPTERPPIPKEMHWDLWLGPAPARPYHASYAPIRWRGWWDFGTGSLGDMGPHLLDPVVDSLQLGSPLRIAAESAPVTKESAPAWSVVKWEVGVGGHPEKTIKLLYYDGGKRPPDEVTRGARLPPDGILFVGSRARLFAPQRGERPTVFPNEKGTTIPLPALGEEAWPSHPQNWADACRSGQAAWMPFARGAKLCEIPLLGNVALRAGKKVEWDAQRQTTGDPAADAFLQREYRVGWEFS